jgi:hypothetical protein
LGVKIKYEKTTTTYEQGILEEVGKFFDDLL